MLASTGIPARRDCSWGECAARPRIFSFTPRVPTSDIGNDELNFFGTAEAQWLPRSIDRIFTTAWASPVAPSVVASAYW